MVRAAVRFDGSVVWTGGSVRWFGLVVRLGGWVWWRGGSVRWFGLARLLNYGLCVSGHHHDKTDKKTKRILEQFCKSHDFALPREISL